MNGSGQSESLRSTCEPAEQGRGCGGGGGKGSEPREARPVKHAPDAVPGQVCQVSWAVCGK